MHCIIFFILLFNLDILANTTTTGGSPKPLPTRRAPRRRSIVSLIFSNSTVAKSVPGNRTLTCRWLRGYKHQNKLCRKLKGFPEVLLQARQLAVNNCEELFRYDAWNCSYKKSIFKKVYRETAFMHAISSAAIMYSIAKSCSDGKLHNCKCADQEEQEDSNSAWKWGGCGDNSKHAKKLATKFLQLRQKGDGPLNILNYNSLVGLKITAESEQKVCKCHGVSASCVMKTCWKSLGTFSKIAETIKDPSYRFAVLQATKNSVSQNIKNESKRPLRLLYLSVTPKSDPCDTSGRRCKDEGNCATLCCGRGVHTRTLTVNTTCRCKWQNDCYDVTCDTCTDTEFIYTCK